MFEMFYGTACLNILFAVLDVCSFLLLHRKLCVPSEVGRGLGDNVVSIVRKGIACVREVFHT